MSRSSASAVRGRLERNPHVEPVPGPRGGEGWRLKAEIVDELGGR